MTLTCPACRKLNETGESLACARCGCDLADLDSLARAAGRHTAESARALRASQWPEALEHAEYSWGLRRSTQAARLAFLAAAGLGEGGRARLWLSRASAPPGRG